MVTISGVGPNLRYRSLGFCSAVRLGGWSGGLVWDLGFGSYLSSLIFGSNEDVEDPTRA